MKLQIVTVQETFEDVLVDVKNGIVANESFWVAIRGLGDENFEEIKQEYHDIEVNHKSQFLGSDGIKFERVTAYSYRLTISGVVYKLKTPKRKLEFGTKRTNVTSASFSLHSKHLVAGDDKGNIKVFDMTGGKNTHTIKKAHFSDVLHTKFFPSGKVFATVGLDMEIKIWGLDTEESVRTMCAQRSMITDVKTVGTKGRNFLTSSKDGSVVLWECGSAANIYSFKRIDDARDPVNCFTIGDIDSPIQARSSLEFETEGKCLYVGYESGLVQQFHLANHSQSRVSFGSKDANSVESIELLSNYLITGHANGEVKVWDTVTQALVCTFKLRENTPVSIIKGINFNEMSDLISLIVYNGSDFLIDILVKSSSGEIQDVTYLVGLPESACITSIDKSDNNLVVSGADGLLAVYNI